jgi:CRP-like cAMP-binding protein
MAVAPWPELVGELIDRALRRSQSQAVLCATSHIKRVDVRLLALLWHVAERWGRVTPDGIVVPLKLTHARLAALVGAQRPSVTTAITRMTRRGVLRRTDAGHFVLAESARAELNDLCLSNDARQRRLRPDVPRMIRPTPLPHAG